MVNNRKKAAYSLLEASLVMILLSILIALASNIYVSKVKAKVKSEAHGRFECYWKNGKIYQHSVVESNDLKEQLSPFNDHCEFIPNQFVKYIVINIVGGGAPVNATTGKGGGAGEFKSLFYPSPQYKYFIYPAKPQDNLNGSSYDSFVQGQASLVSRKQDIVKAKGGINGRDIKNTTIDNVKSCIVSKVPNFNEYKCGTSAKCEIKDGKILVSYCRTNDSYRQDIYKFNDDDAEKYKSIVQGPKEIFIQPNPNRNVWEYYSMSYYSTQGCDMLLSAPPYGTNASKCKIFKDYFNSAGGITTFRNMTNSMSVCLYKLEIEVDLADFGLEGETSSLTKYVTSMNYSGGIANVQPGNGGSVNDRSGHTGGILLLY